MIYVNFNNIKDEIDKYVGHNLGNHGNGNESSNIRLLKHINFFVINRSNYFEQFTTMLEIININFNKVIDQIDKFVGQNLDDHENNNDKSSIRHLKFINFFIKYRSSYSKQFLTIMKIIEVDDDNIEANSIVNTLFE